MAFPNPSGSDEVRVLEGDLYGVLRLTERSEKIKSILAPVVPAVIFALGLNYGKHAAETGRKNASYPGGLHESADQRRRPWRKHFTPVAGPEKVDYEGELAIVIGKAGKNIPVAKAHGLCFRLYMCERCQCPGLADRESLRSERASGFGGRVSIHSAAGTGAGYKR